MDQVVACIDQGPHLLVVSIHELRIGANREPESEPDFVDVFGRLVFGLRLKDAGCQLARQLAHRVLVDGRDLLFNASRQLAGRTDHLRVGVEELQQVLDLLKGHDVAADAPQYFVTLRRPDMRPWRSFVAHVDLIRSPV